MLSYLKRWPAVVAGLGAALCTIILLTLEQLPPNVHWVMAPFSATMVLLFALPDSPLAQPKNIIIGHLLTTLVGLIMLQCFGAGIGSMSLAVGLAIFLMVLSKTTHPPAGANPLLVMLGGHTWSFILNPVAIGAVMIVLIGLFYHRVLCQRAYPVFKV